MNHLDFLNLLKERNYGDFANSNHPMEVGFNFEKPYTLEYKLNYPHYPVSGYIIFLAHGQSVSFDKFLELIEDFKIKKQLLFHLDIFL